MHAMKLPFKDFPFFLIFFAAQYEYCLSFSYHMLVTSGTLRVTASERTSTTESELFFLSGDQGNQWTYATVLIPNSYSDPVVCMNIFGGRYQTLFREIFYFKQKYASKIMPPPSFPL